MKFLPSVGLPGDPGTVGATLAELAEYCKLSVFVRRLRIRSHQDAPGVEDGESDGS